MAGSTCRQSAEAAAISTSISLLVSAMAVVSLNK
jgi:hypothetical protein